MTTVDGLRFEDAWPRRFTTSVDDLEIPVISRDDLIANKRATGRPKDLADVAWLEEENQ